MLIPGSALFNRQPALNSNLEIFSIILSLGATFLRSKRLAVRNAHKGIESNVPDVLLRSLLRSANKKRPAASSKTGTIYLPTKIELLRFFTRQRGDFTVGALQHVDMLRNI